MRFTDLFIRRPVLATVVSLLILLIGLRAFSALPVRQYPLLSNTTITVTTNYPGAAPELMQGFIRTAIEQVVSSAEGIDYVTSVSGQSSSTGTIYVELNYDPSRALAEILAKVNQVRYLIPKEATDPVVQKQNGQGTATMYISFASPEMNGAAISDYLGRVVQPLFATVDGVASADIIGARPSPCGSGSIRPGWRRAASMPTTSPPPSSPIISSRLRARPKAISPSPMSPPIPASPMSSSSARWWSRPRTARSSGSPISARSISAPRAPRPTYR